MLRVSGVLPQRRASAPTPVVPEPSEISLGTKNSLQPLSSNSSGAFTTARRPQRNTIKRAHSANHIPLRSEDVLKQLLTEMQRALCERLDRVESLLLQRPSQSQCKAFEDDDFCSYGVPDKSESLEEIGEEARRPTLRSQWEEGNRRQPQEAVAVAQQQKMLSSLGTNQCFDLEEEEEQVEKYWWVLLPSARIRLVWDLLTMLIIGHDMAVVPVNLAFETGDNGLTELLFWPFLLFWTLDIPLSFITAFYKNGQIEVRMHRIALGYARSWFILDISMVSFSWFEVWVSANPGYLLGRVGKSLRVLRIMHSIRILRLAKLQRIMEDFADRVASEYYQIILKMMKLLLTIVWLNHFIACSWWSLGVNLSDGGKNPSWTSYYGFESTESVGLQYFTALHWSLTQFTPASMEVSARNLPERIFSVVVLLFSVVAFSSVVSSITAAVTQLRHLTNRHDTNFLLLRRYLDTHNVPVDLVVRILHCVEYRLRKQAREVQESEVQFLQLLSKPLQMELSLHIFSPILTQHPFFDRYARVENAALKHLCLEALCQTLLSDRDVLFVEEHPCEQMFFLTCGRLQYTSRNCRFVPIHSSDVGSSDNDDLPCGPSGPTREILMEGDWCCEVSMWCPWRHRGTMCSLQVSEVLALRVPVFASITSNYRLVNRLSCRYGEGYVEKLSEYFSGLPVSDISSFCPEMTEAMVEKAYVERGSAPSSPSSRSSRMSAARMLSRRFSRQDKLAGLASNRMTLSTPSKSTLVDEPKSEADDGTSSGSTVRF